MGNTRSDYRHFQRHATDERMVGDEGASFVKAVAHLGSRLLMLVDFARVVGEETAHVN